MGWTDRQATIHNAASYVTVYYALEKRTQYFIISTQVTSTARH